MKERGLQRIVGTVAVLLVVGLAAAIGSLDYQQEIDDDVKIFRACYGTIIAILGCIQMYVAAILYQHRNNLLLELYQPVWLALFAIAGALTTFASFMFALPEFDISCALRQPIIFTCLTLMGNILVARTWRIGCIMGVSQSFIREEDTGAQRKIETSITTSRLAIMKLFSRISSWRGFISSCGKKKSINNTGIRRKITFADSVWVVAVLMIPQLTLQIINLSIPIRAESVEYEEVYVCESAAGSRSLIVGLVLVIIPFFLSLLLNTKGDGAVPDQFRELSEISSSLLASFFILIITLPTAAVIKDIAPEAYAYLMGASILSFTLPCCFCVAWKRAYVINIKSQGTKKTAGKPTQTFKRSSSTTSDNDNEHNQTRLKEAEDASVMGEMFDTMGQRDKALEVDRGILTLFKSDGEYSWETGFSSSEIRSMGPKELEVVVSTMIASAKRWWKVFQFERKSIEDDKGEEAKSRAFRTCMDGLSIFKEAPAKKMLKDRSFVFPGYSFMVTLIKTLAAYIPPDGQSPEKFENELALHFVEEADYQQYHHCRALAMQADMLRKYGRYEDALLAVDEMKLSYNPHLHSKVILEEYTSDHCADILAASVAWLCYLDRKEDALRLCDYIIKQILPEIGEREFISLTVILYPICLYFKDQGKAKAADALDLYQKHIILPNKGVKTLPVVAELITPMKIMLNCCCSDGDKYASMKDDIAFMLNEEEEKYPAWIETTAVTYLDMAFSTIYAEVCLCLSRMDACDKLESDTLIKEGYRYLDISEITLKKEDGTITSAVAYSYYSRVLSGFKEIETN